MIFESILPLYPTEPRPARKAIPRKPHRLAAGLSFHIEASEDLAAPEAWQTLTVDPADVTVLDADVDGDGTAELMQVRVNVSGKSVHFLRVRVTR